MTELKPCPFCGGEVRINDMGNYWVILRTSRSSCVCRIFMESDQFHDKDGKQRQKEKLRNGRWIVIFLVKRLTLIQRFSI